VPIKTGQCHPRRHRSRPYSPSGFCKPLQNAAICFNFLQNSLQENAIFCNGMLRNASFCFAHTAAEGARANAAKAGLRIVYDRSYPPATTDFSPIVRSIQATNPDLVVICSYPLDSVGMVKAVHEVGLRPKMIGGAMVGLQATAFKTQLGPLLNGFVNFEFWLPVESMIFPGVREVLHKYQMRAPAEGVDPLGYYLAPNSPHLLNQDVAPPNSPSLRRRRFAPPIHGRLLICLAARTLKSLHVIGGEIGVGFGPDQPHIQIAGRAGRALMPDGVLRQRSTSQCAS
jgi:hypothetical protein